MKIKTKHKLSLILVTLSLLGYSQSNDFTTKDSLEVFYDDWTYELETGTIINCALKHDDSGANYLYWRFLDNDSLVYCQRESKRNEEISIGQFQLRKIETNVLCWVQVGLWVTLKDSVLSREDYRDNEIVILDKLNAFKVKIIYTEN